MTSVRSLLDRAVAGERVAEADVPKLATEASFHDLAHAANALREAKTDPSIATYVVDRNINYTNVCDVFCSFCAFYRTPKDKDAYTLTVDQVLHKIEPLVAQGGTQVLLQGGLNDKVPLSYLEEVFRAVKKRFPTVDIHSLTATEIEFYAKLENTTVEDVLKRVKRAGMRSLPGGGMEILSEQVRMRVSPKKTHSDEYIRIHRAAQKLGMTTTATMMFGMGESWAERAEHWRRVRELQDEEHNFTAFIPWTFQSDGSTQLKLERPVPAEEYLRVIALSRIVLDNFDHIQAGWVTEGAKVAQVALKMGADDWGGVLMEENVISAAGTLFGMTPARARWWLRDAGYTPAQRNTYYNILRVFDEATPDEAPVAASQEPARLEVHLGTVGNRGRPAKVVQDSR